MGSARLQVVRDDVHERAAARRRIPADGSDPQRVRLADAALSCIARQGIAKTTLDDVARAAGCSRATVYRVFPGGKDGLMSAVVDTEVARFFSALALRMGAASDLEDVLVAGMNEAAVRITGHPGLSFLLEHEPEVILPHLAFSHMDDVLEVSSTFTAPFLGRWLDHDEAKRVAQWAARIVLSHLLCPADGVDLTDEDRVRRLVRTFVLPADGSETHETTRSTATTATVRSGGVEGIDRPSRSTRAIKGEAS
ncbi:MAG TPA: TetR/AcrR family transcriptional regulator [Acidimicrobiales bacterium]|nr:TetR/AcrR family transcriptional regulator [Acidimicrobiales bacterium]